MNIKAFTILEALISLVLMSIIIGLIFTLVNFMDKQLMMMANENNQELEYHLFNTTIKRDIHASNDFDFAQDIIRLKNYNGSDIKYKVTQGVILRDNGKVKDTFDLEATLSPDTKNAIASSNNNNKIELDIKLLNEVIHAVYFLKQDSSKTINKTYYDED